MAFSTILRRNSSYVVPLAVCAVGSSRLGHGAAVLSNCFQGNVLSDKSLKNGSFIQSSNFASLADRKKVVDENLVRAIDSEIKSMGVQKEETPKEFPFVIYRVTECTLLLTREYLDETIQVEAFLYDEEEGSESDDDNGTHNKDKKDSSSDSSDDCRSKDSSDSSTDDGSSDDNSSKDDDKEIPIPLLVTVSKSKGKEMLKFEVSAFRSEMCIDTINVSTHAKSESSDELGERNFRDLDSRLQEAFTKFLAIRGMDCKTASFLHDYMEAECSRHQDLMWLKQLKKFVKK